MELVIALLILFLCYCARKMREAREEMIAAIYQDCLMEEEE